METPIFPVLGTFGLPLLPRFFRDRALPNGRATAPCLYSSGLSISRRWPLAGWATAPYFEQLDALPQRLAQQHVALSRGFQNFSLDNYQKLFDVRSLWSRLQTIEPEQR